MKKILFIFFLLLSIFSCESKLESDKSKLESEMYLNLLEFKKHVLTVEEDVKFIKDEHISIRGFDIDKELLTTIENHRNDFKKIEKGKPNELEYEMDKLKNKIIEEFITKYNKRLSESSPFFINGDDMTKFYLFNWIAKQYLVETGERKNNLSLFPQGPIIDELKSLEFNERLDLVKASEKFKKDPVRIRLCKEKIKQEYSIYEFITTPKIYYKDDKWGESSYSGAYIIGKIVNESSKKASGSIKFPLYKSETNEYIGTASDYFYDIPPHTTYSFKTLAIFDGSVYYKEPELKYQLEK